MGNFKLTKDERRFFYGKTIYEKRYNMKSIKGLVKQLILEGVEDDYKRKLLSDNTYLNMQMVNHYVNEFNKIKNNLPTDKRDITKYDWDSLESVVDSNQSIEKIEKGMIEIDNSDVIYNQNNLKVLKANTKQACVKYGTGYGFCISSRGAGNQYYNYRYGNYNDTREKSIYFVIDDDKTKDIKSTSPLRFKDPSHMLVIMVTKEMLPPENPYSQIRGKNFNLFYQVTQADNDGDDNMSWDDIVKLQPKLNGLQKLFQPLKPNSKEYTLHVAKKAFLDRIEEWREENDEWLGNDNGDDLRLVGINFYTNDVDTLEFNYKLLRKMKELSIDNKLYLIQFNDKEYSDNSLKLITPLFRNMRKPSILPNPYTSKDVLVYNLYVYVTNLNLKNGFRVESNNPIIKKDSIIVDGDITNSSFFNFKNNEILSFQYDYDIERSSIELDEHFYKYVNEIEKLYKEYINDITYTLANT
jgi:hypothetical protein